MSEEIKSADPVPPKKLRRKRESKPTQQYPADFAGLEPPKSLWRSRRIGEKEYELRNKDIVKGVLHMAGRGSKTAQVMFVSPCALMEEQWDSRSAPPMLLKGPAGNLFLRCLSRSGFPDDSWWYTTLCKYNVPKLKPKPYDIRWNQQMLIDEITNIKPRLIVCLGKLPFDFLYSKKFNLRDVQGGFFRSDTYDCLLYPMDSVVTPLHKPEYLERFMVDLKQVRQTLDELNGIQVAKVVTSYSVIEKAEQLQNLMADLKAKLDDETLTYLATDCEWDGQTYVDGQLRATQFGWKPGEAAYIRFMDDKLQYAFDQPLSVVREIIAPTLNHPRLKFVGHAFSADAVWLKHHLGVIVYNRCGFDTMFAQQNINEYADLKLERNAVAYTDLGRYDIDLTVWKKTSKWDEEDNEGYGKIPDKILIPYGLRDVDATLRIFPILWKKLHQQGLSKYYFDFTLPFVTNGFTEMMESGLPINNEYLDEVREVFTRNRDMLIKNFQLDVKKEATSVLCQRLMKIDSEAGQDLFLDIYNTINEAKTADEKLQAVNLVLPEFKSFVGVERLPKYLPFLEHWLDADNFNVNSTDHLRRWLFEVKGYTPFKTTKRDGIQMAWDKVLTFEPEKQALFTPAADKQTIKVFAAKDKLVAQIEELKSVGNIVKAFLRGPDPDTGKEQGMHKWIQSDNRIHANFSLTETGRPRAWKPNILNWPKAITKPLEKGFERINNYLAAQKRLELEKEGVPNEEIEKQINLIIKKPVSLRSAVQAPEGWCLIDMDLKTAEVVALGYLSGDENMIKVLTEPDKQFARVSKDDPKKVVRIAYTENSRYPEAEKDPSLLCPETDERILRSADGSVIHPKRDLHWEMGEGVAQKPREKCDERMERDGCGKVGNFCLLHSSLVLTHRGEVPIQDVRLDDLLWDGQEWVSHEGVVCNGVKTVHHYQGLWATDNHEVWIENGNKVSFGDARRNGWNLFRVQTPYGETTTQTGASLAVSGNTRKERKRALRIVDGMQTLWSEGEEVFRSPRTREINSLLLCSQQVVSGSEILYIENSICGDATAMRKGQPQVFSKLQRPWNQSSIRIMPGICDVGLTEVAQHGFQRLGVRSDRKQRALRKEEYSVGNQEQKSAQQPCYQTDQLGYCSGVSFPLSGSDLHGYDLSTKNVSRNDGRRNSAAASSGSARWMEKEERGDNQASVTGLVYDILNVGPQHRFTCSRVLVSNSIPYGASPTLLERMIEVNTGKKPLEGTGDRMITSYETMYPIAADFLKRMEYIVEDPGYYRAISGRLRHFFVTELADVTELRDYTREGILSPLRRQARNFPMQNLVADTTARALQMFIAERNEVQLQSSVLMLLYDAITAISPLEQAKQTIDILRRALTVRNPWTVHGRTFTFEVDVSVGFRWGVKATKEEKQLLAKYL